MISKYQKFLSNCRNFPRFFAEKHHWRQPPPPPQRPYDVSRGQNRYVMLPLMVPSRETVTKSVYTSTHCIVLRKRYPSRIASIHNWNSVVHF